MHGNWEYDEGKDKLFNYESLLNAFKEKVPQTDDQYLSCDVALMGSDKLVITRWRGLTVEEIITKDKSSANSIEVLIKDLAEKHSIARKNIIIDSDGVGQYLSHYMKGVNAFINNAKPMKNENYKNLKSQCYYKLAEQINAGNIHIKCKNIEIRNKIIEELDVVRRKNIDTDTKLAILSKKEIKAAIGRSPDYGDSLMMRMKYMFGNNNKVLAWG